MSPRKLERELEEKLLKLPIEKAERFRKFLSEVPEEVWEMLRLERKKENQPLTQAEDGIENIYFLLDGSVRAVDYSVKGSSYEHTRFDAGMIIGSTECIFGSSKYLMTLVTATPCVFLVVPIYIFERWLWKDTDTVRAEIECVRSLMVSRARKSRAMLMMSGTERLIYLLMSKCENLDPADLYILPLSRQELADQSGCSVKTVNRSIKKLEESGFLLRDGHKVKITQNQFVAMKDYMDRNSSVE